MTIDYKAFEGATPGPWKTLANYVYSKDGNVCSVGEPRATTIVGYTELEIGSPDASEAYANTRLIAAAHELLSDHKRMSAEIERLSNAVTDLLGIFEGQVDGPHQISGIILEAHDALASSSDQS